MWQRAENELRVNPDDVPLPPYYPDTPTVRQDVARCYSNIEELDDQIGEYMDQLESDGLLDSTIIIFFGDNGGPLPRMKRELYDSGLRVPLIIRFPHAENAGTINEELVSFVDFAPTVLSLAGVEVPESIQGQPFLGEQKLQETRQYIYAARDRMDTEYDLVRAVGDGRYKYFKNYKPDLPYYQNIEYRLQMNMMPELLHLNDVDSLNDVQKLWFRQSKPDEELFDTLNDPHELVNLADDPVYLDKLIELRTKHEEWTEQYGDFGFTYEFDLLNQWWPGLEQQETEPPIINTSNDTVFISCETEGTSIAYKIDPSDGQPKIPYSVYHEPIVLSGEGRLSTKFHRIGFKASKLVRHKYDTAVQDFQKPDEFELDVKNYPNPFNNLTVIEFSLPRKQDVNLSVYNTRGQKVSELASGQYKEGVHRIRWDGSFHNGHSASTGLYFYRLETQTEIMTGKCLLVK